jgi:hypothetical protein
MGTLNILAGLKGYPKETLDEIEKIYSFIQDGDFEDAEQTAEAYATTLAEMINLKKSLQINSKKITGLDITKGLNKYDGDEDVYIKILRSYAASTRSILEKIGTVNEENLAKYRISVHSIKGTSLDIYADGIGNAASRLEEAAVAGDIDFINKNTPAFLNDTWTVINAIEAVLLECTPVKPKSKKDKMDESLIQDLLAACEIYSIDGVDKAMAELEKYEYSDSEDNEIVEWLRERIRMMEFTDIIARLSK